MLMIESGIEYVVWIQPISSCVQYMVVCIICIMHTFTIAANLYHTTQRSIILSYIIHGFWSHILYDSVEYLRSSRRHDSRPREWTTIVLLWTNTLTSFQFWLSQRISLSLWCKRGVLLVVASDNVFLSPNNLFVGTAHRAQVVCCTSGCVRVWQVISQVGRAREFSERRIFDPKSLNWNTLYYSSIELRNQLHWT